MKEIITCSICLENTKTYQIGRNRIIAPRGCCDKILKCKHVFHNACIKKWYEIGVNGRQCPTCRNDIHFYNHGIYYYDLLRVTNNILSAIIKVINEYSVQNQIDTFIYFDNASIILYVCNKKINRIHFSSWFLFNQSFKK
jgi:hypothetical protein